MITPDDNEKRENVRTDFDQTADNGENLTNGETSSIDQLDRSGFTNKPKRKSTSLGASHEPGATPGSEF